MRKITKVRLGLLAVLGAASATASAATVTMSLSDYLAVATTGSATLSITDIASNEVQVTLTPNFAAGSLQTITGLWLNAPGFTGLTVTPVNPTPNPFVSSAYTATQTTVPSGTTGTVAGQYDLYVKFSNSTPLIRGTTAEVFDITATGGAGFSATSFDVADAPSGAGSPSNLYALVGLTNGTGAAGSGVGYIGATSASLTPVPLPAALPLLLTGLGGLGFLRRNRQA